MMTAMLKAFQYRKRYEITCDIAVIERYYRLFKFQYRKRYEITCDATRFARLLAIDMFQYRKRYEITCDIIEAAGRSASVGVSIPQAV